MNFVSRTLLIIAIATMPLCAAAEDLSQPPDIEIQKQGNITNVLTSTPGVKRQTALLKAIRGIPRNSDQQVIDWIRKSSAYLPPAFLYELSRRLFAADKNAAMEWFAIAGARATYDAFRCVDETSRQGIVLLPLIAQEVALYARTHRKEFNRAGLKALARPDLFTDQVSPIWICSHGMKAVIAGLENQTPAKGQWVTPEKDWPQLRQELVTKFSDAYRQQAAPQNDPVPVTKRRYAVHELPDKRNARKHAWLNGNELVVGIDNGSKASRKSIDLFLWNPRTDEKMREIHRGTVAWCAGQGNIMYETGLRKPERKLIEYEYEFGPIGNTSGHRIIIRDYMLPVATQLKGSGLSNQVRGGYKQSPFDCSFEKNDRLFEKHRSSWSRLLGNKGYLVFSSKNKALSGAHSNVKYIKNTDDDGVELPIRLNGISPSCLKYYDFKKAYFLYPCRAGPKHLYDFKKHGCIPYWWLKEQGGEMDVTEDCAPMDSVSESLPMMQPSKAGLLRVTKGRRTSQGVEIGGVYLTNHRGKVTKIFDGWIEDSLMSPNGCLLALWHRSNQFSINDMILNVLDVCSARPGAKR